MLFARGFYLCPEGKKQETLGRNRDLLELLPAFSSAKSQNTDVDYMTY